MIKTFADAETEKIWNEIVSRRLPVEIQSRALRKLAILSQARDLNDLRVPPSNWLEALKGKRNGQHSIASTTNGEFVSDGRTATRSR